MVIFTQAAKATVIPDYTTDNPDEDGYISLNGGVYVRNTALNNLYGITDATSYHSYLEYPTATIPDNATILNVSLYCRAQAVAGTHNLLLHAVGIRPSTSADAATYAAIGAGATYATQAITGIAWYTIDLGAVACTDLQALLASDYFPIGITGPDTVSTSIYSEESGDLPVLTVTYSYMGVYYTFASEYEDDTNIGINAVVLDSDGTASTITIPSGSSITYGFDERPAYVTWNVSTSYFRRIYVSADTGSFTLTIPESTFAVFTPIIRDFTNVVSSGGAYFETYRTVGGINTLIERVPVISLVNGIPTTLTVNRLYTLSVDTNTTDYSWSFYSTTSMPSPILILDVLNYNEVMQFNTRYIHIEADRPTATSIRFNYTDDLLHTLNVTMSFKLRNGTTAFTHTINATNSFTYTWNAATNTTEYTAWADIIQSDFGNLTYSRSFLGAISYSTPPSLVGLGTIGGLNMSQGFAAIILLGVAGLFSAKNAAGGLVICALVAAVLSYIQWIAISTGIIVFVIFIAVAFEMGRSKN